MSYLETQTELTIYMPKKGTAFGQATKVRNPKKAWQMTLEFLEEFTIYQKSTNLSLRVEGINNIKAVTEILNQPSDGYDSCQIFNVTQSDLPNIIDFICNLKPSHNAVVGEVELQIDYKFLWRDFVENEQQIIQSFNKNEIPIDYISTLYCYLNEKRLFIQPVLAIPHQWQTVEFKELIEKIHNHLPFKLKKKNFIRLIAKKDNSSFYGRKLPDDWYQNLVQKNPEIDWF